MEDNLFKRVALLCLAILFLVGFSYPPQGNVDIYVMEGRLNWKDSFREPFEILYMILYDSQMIGFTTQEEYRVNVDVVFIEGFLLLKEKKISDIAIMVHNHFPMPFFSWSNGLFLKALKNKGFKGSFGVYHVPTDTIKWAVRDGD